MVASITQRRGRRIFTASARQQLLSRLGRLLYRVAALSSVLLVLLLHGSTAAEGTSASAMIKPGDIVAATGEAFLQDEDHVFLTLNSGEQSRVEGVLGKCALLGIDREGKRIRGWVVLENLAVVKRYEANATPYCDQAGDVYYRLRLADVKFPDGRCPWDGWQPTEEVFGGALYPRVTLDGTGEAYVAFEWSNIRSLSSDGIARLGWLVARSPRGQDVSGWLHFPLPDRSGTARFRFKIAQAAAEPVSDGMFVWGKAVHYLALARSGLPGGAWFRHQAGRVARQAGGPPYSGGADRSRPNPDEELTRTFDLFSGGRALAENLQLDGRLAEIDWNDKPVDVSTLGGINIPAFDWAPLLKDTDPPLDRLATCVPHDQHVVFFASPKAAMALSDAVAMHDTPLLHFVEPRSESAHVIERYQSQLGLGISELERLVTPHGVRTMALTGSDPFFALGTDVAVLFEAAQPAALEQALWGKILLAAGSHSTVRQHKSEIEGLSYRAVVSPDRRISSFLVRWDDTVIVTNSLRQVQRLADIRQNRCAPISTLPEYRYFRTRYPLGAPQETALVFLSDAAIRRWCSPAWRIADSRRIRAAAAMADPQAAHLESILSGKVEPGKLKASPLGIDLGTVVITSTGIVSSRYGTQEFLCPISELTLDTVTQAEVEAYNDWREAFERDWLFAMHPAAIRVEVAADRLAADLTVMPLIANSKYPWLIELFRDANIGPQAGDRHATLLHGIAAIDQSSPLFLLLASSFLSSWEPKVSLEWLGPTAELYCDPDPLWQSLARLAASQEATEADRNRLNRLFEIGQFRVPVAVRLAVADQANARAFLDVARQQWKNSAGDNRSFEELTYRGKNYSQLASGVEEDSMIKLYGYLADDSLLLSLSEPLLHMAIDRQLAQTKEPTPTEASAKPVSEDDWLGTHICLRVDRELLEVANILTYKTYNCAMQHKAWANIPILNEWKRRFPNEDPIAVHRRFSHTELICPGRGGYVWNDAWKTFESTLYGHPGQPKAGPPASPVLSTFASGNFGIDFEERGLRARVSLQRGKKPN